MIVFDPEPTAEPEDGIDNFIITKTVKRVSREDGRGTGTSQYIFSLSGKPLGYYCPAPLKPRKLYISIENSLFFLHIISLQGLAGKGAISSR